MYVEDARYMEKGNMVANKGLKPQQPAVKKNKHRRKNPMLMLLVNVGVSVPFG